MTAACALPGRLARRALPWAVPCLLLALSPAAGAQAEGAPGKGAMEILRALTGLDRENIAASLRALILVTILGVVPSVVLLATSFPRVVIVLSFLRHALGGQDLPPNTVVFGLALLLTGAVMTPVWKEVHERAYVPLVEAGAIGVDEALERAEAPVKRFLLARTLRSDLRLFVEISGSGAGPGSPAGDPASPPARLEDLSFLTILPAYVLSELKVAFQMGFLLYLPFVLIDLLVSSVLVSMGMFMLPPHLVSFPLKILVFVLADGWTLVVAELARSVQGVA